VSLLAAAATLTRPSRGWPWPRQTTRPLAPVVSRSDPRRACVALSPLPRLSSHYSPCSRSLSLTTHPSLQQSFHHLRSFCSTLDLRQHLLVSGPGLSQSFIRNHSSSGKQASRHAPPGVSPDRDCLSSLGFGSTLSQHLNSSTVFPRLTQETAARVCMSLNVSVHHWYAPLLPSPAFWLGKH
jgi:hypothetical protein